MGNWKKVCSRPEKVDGNKIRNGNEYLQMLGIEIERGTIMNSNNFVRIEEMNSWGQKNMETNK